MQGAHVIVVAATNPCKTNVIETGGEMARYCAHCGKQISEKALFCKYCGGKADFEVTSKDVSKQNASNKVHQKEISNVSTDAEAASAKPSVNTQEKKAADLLLSKKMIAVIIAALALVIVTIAVGAVMYFGKTNDTVMSSDTKTTEKNEVKTPDKISEVQDQAIESKGSGTGERSEDNSKYQVGESYTVQTNLRVREGPGKEYRVLDRSELTPEDYAKSVDSTTTTDALMEKGVVITCLEMSGSWMRISSGWVCVEDDGEVLVE